MSVLIHTVPVSVVGVLFVFVLMIMSGMDWGGAQSHMRHTDNKAIKLKMILRLRYNLIYVDTGSIKE